MYYLQSRYYDPAIGRFINEDTFATTDPDGFLSYDMFSYCENSPVARTDLDGHWTLAFTRSLNAAGGAGANLSSGWVIDGHFNCAKIETYAFQAGTPDAGFAGNLNFSNADTIYDLEGNGLTAGGSVSLPVSLEVDIGFSQSPVTGKNVTSGTLSLGLGLAPFELHAIYGKTTLQHPFNVKNALNYIWSNIKSTSNQSGNTANGSGKTTVKPNSRSIPGRYTK